MKTLKRLLQENYYISDKEYLLLEELVTSKQLDKLLTFEKIDKKDAINIILSDEYNNGKDLDIYSYEDAEEALFLFDKVNAYKIKYKDKLVGVFGFTLLKDCIRKLERNGVPSHAIHLESLLHCFYHYFYTLKNVNERLILSKNPKQHAPARYNYLFKDFLNTNSWARFVENVYLKSAYISFLQISTEAKEKYEISPMALILTFYKKLEHFLLENNVKLMIAHGIDQKTTNKYVKVGKFENPVDLFEYWYQNPKEYNHCIHVSYAGMHGPYKFNDYYDTHGDLFEHFVIKRID